MNDEQRDLIVTATEAEVRRLMQPWRIDPAYRNKYMQYTESRPLGGMINQAIDGIELQTTMTDKGLYLRCRSFSAYNMFEGLIPFGETSIFESFRP